MLCTRGLILPPLSALSRTKGYCVLRLFCLLSPMCPELSKELIGELQAVEADIAYATSTTGNYLPTTLLHYLQASLLQLPLPPPITPRKSGQISYFPTMQQDPKICRNIVSGRGKWKRGEAGIPSRQRSIQQQRQRPKYPKLVGSPVDRTRTDLGDASSVRRQSSARRAVAQRTATPLINRRLKGRINRASGCSVTSNVTRHKIKHGEAGVGASLGKKRQLVRGAVDGGSPDRAREISDRTSSTRQMTTRKNSGTSKRETMTTRKESTTARSRSRSCLRVRQVAARPLSVSTKRSLRRSVSRVSAGGMGFCAPTAASSRKACRSESPKSEARGKVARRVLPQGGGLHHECMRGAPRGQVGIFAAV